MDLHADQSDARCVVRTFREGMLSRVGHDLVLEVTRFEARVSGGEVSARFDAASLRVRSAVHGGHEDPGALSDRDRAQIEETARTDVLDAAAHPWVTFHARLPEGYTGRSKLRGELTLNGVTRPLEVEVSPHADGVRVFATVQQKDFGMKPYAALMGALRVRAEVEVEVTLPWAPR